MPKKMFWTEAILLRLPVARKLREQILLRLLVSFLLWLTGFVAFGLDGLGAEYVSNVQFYATFFGTNFIILFGSYMIQESLADTVLSIRPFLKVDDSEFKKFFERMEQYTYSVIPVLLIASLFTLIMPGSRLTLEMLTNTFESTRIAWIVSLILFINILSGTGIWMGVSIWLTTFLISRQPLQVELSPRTAQEFRGLANLTLGFAVFYFIAIAMGLIVPLSSRPIISMIDVFTSPLLLYIIIGVAGVFVPFYNIHRALVTLKRHELIKIDEEYELTEKRLNTAQKEPSQKSIAESLALMDSLFSLQIRERRVKAAKEWPIDIGFASKLLTLILTPAAVRILQEILNRLMT